jgi:hypothetical protein
MAEERKQEYDDLIEQWIPDAASPDLKKLTGFTLGRSDHDDRYRLYLTATLDHYIEFSKDDTVHAVRATPERTHVWVRPETRIQETRSQSLSADFLRGEIRRGFLRGVGDLARGTMLMVSDCPRSGCAHCTVSCSSLPDPGGSTGFTCAC